MKKKIAIGIISFVGVIYTGIFASSYKNFDSNYDEVSNSSKEKNIEIKQVCDGYTITSDCVYDGIVYSTYIYHPEQPEKTHVETEVTYTDEIVGYCTMCNDGTRSPSCSTGRGTCSKHGGVREWNAPIYSKVRHTNEITVVDSEKVEAYWEKVKK